jgi:hypothetical protein
MDGVIKAQNEQKKYKKYKKKETIFERKKPETKPNPLPTTFLVKKTTKYQDTMK